MENIKDTILEPLSEATRTTLSPLPWKDGEFITIAVNKDIDRFILKGVFCFPNDPNTTIPQGVPILEHPQYGAMEISHYGRSYAFTRLLNRLPENHKLGFDSHQVAATDFSVLILEHTIPKDKLIFLSDEARLLYDIIMKRFQAQSTTAKIIAKFKVDGVVPEMPKDFIPHPNLSLTPYQKAALVASLHQESFALFMEQGTGKTPIGVARVNLESARKRAKDGGMYTALIICPKQVRSNWAKEFERFSTIPGKVSVVRGGKVRRVKNLLDGIRDEEDCAWGACIISMDSVSQTWEAIKRIPWDIAILDESHGIKNPNSKRFKQLRQLQDVHCRQRMALTGTPIANSIFDLWGQLEFLGNGLSGFQSHQSFRTFHGTWEKSYGSPVEKLVALKGIPLIQERLSRVSFLMKKKDANLNLPDKLYDTYEVSFSPRAEKIYKDLASKLVAELEEMLESTGENKQLVCEHALTKLLRLAQISSGHIRWDGTEKCEQIDKVNPKAQAVVDMINDPGRDPNGKTIVWCCFNEDQRVISKYLHNNGIKHVGYKGEVMEQYRVKDSEEAEQVFNKDKDCKVFLANPASGGSGLNLLGYDWTISEEPETYTDHEIFFSCNWSAVNRSQAEDRAHRRGTKVPVRITDLIIPDTIDTIIRDRVKDKIESADKIQDLRGILSVLRKHS